jgi:hypothetical protein
MFQCMIEINVPLDILEIWERLHTYQHFCIFGHPSGKLGIKISFEDRNTCNNVIGSVSVKMVVGDSLNISVLMFRKGQIKISGGLDQLDCDEHLTNKEFDHVLISGIIQPVLTTLLDHQNIEDIEIRLKSKCVNALLRRSEPLGKENYLQFIGRLGDVFSVDCVTLPEIMQPDGKKRGRICATKVKNEDNKRGSFQLDHSGNVQFFAYNDIDDLKKHYQALLKIWL